MPVRTLEQTERLITLLMKDQNASRGQLLARVKAEGGDVAEASRLITQMIEDKKASEREASRASLERRAQLRQKGGR